MKWKGLIPKMSSSYACLWNYYAFTICFHMMPMIFILNEFFMLHMYSFINNLHAWILGTSIGKRYARTDELGVPFAITVDSTSSVTIRERDSKDQIRVIVEKVASVVKDVTDGQRTWENVLQIYPPHSSVPTDEWFWWITKTVWGLILLLLLLFYICMLGYVFRAVFFFFFF